MTPLAQYVWPPLTTVRQPVTEMARRAIAALTGQERFEPFPRPSGELMIRKSCGC